MNSRRSLSLLAALLVLGFPGAVAAANDASDPLEKLSQEQRAELTELLATASRDVAGIHMFEALQNLEKAEQLAPDFHVIYNLRGAVYTRLKDFDQATANFEKSLQLRPDAYEPKFNLFEIQFITGEYALARAGFQQLLEDHPRLPGPIRDMTSYKILLCHVGLGQKDKAAEVAKRFSYLDDTPAYYFARAAIKLAGQDHAGASEWMLSATRIYGQPTAQLYIDGLQEMGLLPSITAVGGQAPEAPPTEVAPSPGLLP